MRKQTVLTAASLCAALLLGGCAQESTVSSEASEAVSAISSSAPPETTSAASAAAEQTTAVITNAAEGSAEPTLAPVGAHTAETLPWRRAYANYLLDETQFTAFDRVSDGIIGVQYDPKICFCYFDGDDIPELLLYYYSESQPVPEMAYLLHYVPSAAGGTIEKLIEMESVYSPDFYVLPKKSVFYEHYFRSMQGFGDDRLFKYDGSNLTDWTDLPQEELAAYCADCSVTIDEAFLPGELKGSITLGDAWQKLIGTDMKKALSSGEARKQKIADLLGADAAAEE